MIWQVLMLWWMEMTKADFVLADKAYDADERMRQKLEEKGCTPIIPPKSYRKNLLDYDKDTYKLGT